MKNIQLVSFTSGGSFLYLDGNQAKEGTFQGLQFVNSILTREILKNYINKQIQCRFDKNMGKIRYQNLSFYQQIIKLNAAKINELQFSESKLFTTQQKQKLKSAQIQLDTDKVSQFTKGFIDYTQNRKNLINLFSKIKKVQAKIQYFSSDICISFLNQDKTNYVPIRLRNIQHYFQLIQKVNFTKFLKQHKLIDVSFVSCKYNLAKKQYEIEAVLCQQVEKRFLSEGWGTTSLKNLNFIKPELFSQFRKHEQQAKTSHKNIFAKPFQILSLVYTKNNLVAVVEEIIQGYIYKIRTKNDQVIKIQLAKIYCPISNQAAAFSCRQFARKNLIGKQVNVFLTKDQGLNILGSLVRFSDNKDIQSLMIENGFGFVKDQLKGTMFYAKLQTLQKKAKDQRKGIHNQKNVGYQFYQDFTTAHSKKQKLDKKNSIQSKQQFLRQIQTGDQCVIEKCIDLVTYIVRIDSHKKLIRVKLDGVSKLLANPRLPEVIQLQKNSQNYILRHFYQRTVSLELTEYNQTNNNFIGIIRHSGKGKQKVSFQQSLLTEGLVCLFNNQLVQQKWIECEKIAQKKGVGCWKSNLKHFVRKDIFDEEKDQFMGKFSWVQDGELASVQPISVNQRLDLVYDLLSNKQQLKHLNKQDVVPGSLCAAEYQSEMCRARIISLGDKMTALVKFIDWGNKQTVAITTLRQLPNKLQYLPPLCCQVLLDLIKPLKTKDPDHIQRLRQYMMEGQCKFVKVYGNTVNVYVGSNHLNTSLIYEGLVKADLSKIIDETTKKHMIDQMNKLRKQLVGVWDLQSNNSDQQQGDYD